MWKFDRDEAKRNEEADYDKLSGAKLRSLNIIVNATETY